MSPKLKRLSGSEVVDILKTFGFQTFSQRGSHVKLRRLSLDNEKQTLTIPLYHELDIGTLKAIIRQATRYIPEIELKKYFYSD
ncbi:MAG: type II toxin-antitoxin system HicA family toxin [Dehalococcoidales bacterium]